MGSRDVPQLSAGAEPSLCASSADQADAPALGTVLGLNEFLATLSAVCRKLVASADAPPSLARSVQGRDKAMDTSHFGEVRLLLKDSHCLREALSVPLKENVNSLGKAAIRGRV